MNNNLRKRAALPQSTGKRPPRRSRGGRPTAKRRSRSPSRKTTPPTLGRVPQWKGILGAIAALSSSATVLFGGAWLSFELLTDPQSVTWLQSWFPAWSQVPIANKETPKTLAEIQAQIRAGGELPSPPLSLDSSSADKTETSTRQDPQLLLPVLEEVSCQGNSGDSAEGKTCQQLAQLRVYQPVFNPENPSDREPYYQLINQLAIVGPERSFVVSPLSNVEDLGFGLNGPQPLTQIARFDNAPDKGIWFNLSSQRKVGEVHLTYGQVLHYNPETAHISVMAEWSSPGGHSPRWEEVTGEGDPELVIDQTVGLEPQVKIFSLTQQQFFLNPYALEEISLLTPALSSRAYKDALLLAKSGLWSAAWELMASVKQDNADENWPQMAQRQLDLMRFHAQMAQKQAKGQWENPAQQVRTALIDGNWKQGLEVFEAQLSQGEDMREALKEEKPDLWNRVETAVLVNPALAEAKLWGVLLLAARYDDAEAIAWFEEQGQNTPELTERMYDLLDKQASAIARENLKQHQSQIVGTAWNLTQVKPQDWRLPRSGESLKLSPGQVWYQLRVSRFHDSRRWRQKPFNEIQFSSNTRVSQFWKELGLHNDPQIQILSGLPNGATRTVLATVKAVQLQQGDLLLLASGEGIPALVAGEGTKALALTGSALKWRSPDTMTVAQLKRQDPDWIGKMLPALWQELQAGGQLPAGEVPSPEQMLKQLGGWLVQSLDLTGNGLSEAVLTLRSDALVRSRLPQTNNGTPYRTRTLIFNDQGALIYSELTTAAAQSVTGIADLPDAELPVLVVEGTSGYSLQQWSGDRNRFEF